MNQHKCEGFDCAHCGKKYGEKQNLKRHIKEQHSDGANRVTCATCDKSFAAKRYLEEHLASAHGVNDPFVCNLCGKEFKYQSSMKRHIDNLHSQ